MTATVTVTRQDAAFLLFGQAMPALDSDWRADVLECLSDGDYDSTLALLVRVIDRDRITVDADLLAQARVFAASELAHMGLAT